MTDHFSFDVFLSHNQADKLRVCRLAERLKGAGLRVWLDEWVIQPGDIISLKVDEGLEQSRALLLCLSPAALASDWVSLERSTAIHRDPANTGRRLIPLLLADCKLPDTLRRYKYVDFREDAEVWIAEDPDHMIHSNDERFLGAYPDVMPGTDRARKVDHK